MEAKCNQMDNNAGKDTEVFLQTPSDELCKDPLSVHFNDEIAAQKKQIKQHRLLCGAVLIISTCLAHFLSSGVSFSIGVYYVTFLEVFGQSSGLTSCIGSLNFAALCAAGPVSGVLFKKIGCSWTLLIGGLLSTSGLVTSAYSVNIYTVFLTFGLLTGFGFGLVFCSCNSIVAIEFDKWRKFALGVSMAGVGLGTCVHPFLTKVFIDVYGWRGALLLTGALVAHVCALALLIRLVSTQTLPYTNNNKTLEQSKSDKSTYYSLSIQEQHTPWYCTLSYSVLHLNILFYCFGQSVIYTHVVAYARQTGMALSLSASLVSVIGISNFIGRTALGTIAQHPKINVKVLYSLCYVIAALCCYGYCVWKQYIVMAILVALLGFCLSGFGPLFSEIVCMTVGVRYFASAYGYLMVTMAMGTLLGAPSAGWLYDATNVYEYSFYLGGMSLMLSAFIMAVPNVIKICS